VAEEVRAMACGLAELGFKRGDNLAIIGDNRPRLYWAMCAAQMLGGVPVPLYQDAVAGEMAFVLTDGEIRFAIVEDQEQVDKMLEIKDQCPSLQHILYDDPRGMRHYTQTWLQGLDEVIAMGRVHDRTSPTSSRRNRQGASRGRRRDALHLGHHRQAQGRLPDP
jgi:long-chain acyl-CoA synthetase